MSAQPAQPDIPFPQSHLRLPQRAGRQLMANGVLWLVYELSSSMHERPGKASLVFECDGAVRRVRNFPENWRDLTDEELFVLSWRT